ncbi:polyunsaturated fatty acid lipoxygenase ALOX15B [Oryzias melastigma]|nr:polyunsaturated fatty acid lipoxygenase ALOX15B [Oryzias melastigma]
MTLEYEVTVFTEEPYLSWSLYKSLNITLEGTKGKSEVTSYHKFNLSFFGRNEIKFPVKCSSDLGHLVGIKLEAYWSIPFQSPWYHVRVEAESPIGTIYRFPIHQSIFADKEYFFREGKGSSLFLHFSSYQFIIIVTIIQNNPFCDCILTAMLPQKEKVEELIKHRQKEIKDQRKIYRWKVFEKGMPHCLESDTLPLDETYSFSKKAEFGLTAAIEGAKLYWTKFTESMDTLTNLDQVEDLLKNNLTITSEYVMNNWKKDSFFGSQFLNGLNPMMIRRIHSLPQNLSVDENMIIPGSSDSLKTEMRNGNIFLCDYIILDGVESNTINGKKQYLTAPLVLLHKNQKDEMMPIAIQLKQNPGPDNPVFLPSDSENDWLLAKLFVRSADFNLHELNYHLLRTHLLAEVFAVALKRNLPRVHPVHKILIRHTRYTLQINVKARNDLISQDGVFTEFTASGGAGMLTIMEKSLSNLTYQSLCIPDDIEDRGLNDVKNFYYKEDGLKLWNIMHSFVEDTLSYYYGEDSDVKDDEELQNWIKEISEHGFLREAKTEKPTTGEQPSTGNTGFFQSSEKPEKPTTGDQPSTGNTGFFQSSEKPEKPTTGNQPSTGNTEIPKSLETKEELFKFVTMVMFTCSAQHAAVNSGQYDFYGWMPNGPPTMQEPPPTEKGTVTEERILKTLPGISIIILGMATSWVLSMQAHDSSFLPDFKRKYFTEHMPCDKIGIFQKKLLKLSKEINKRNEGADLPYTYLDPKLVENSVSI